jgi:hypothetical protein
MSKLMRKLLILTTLCLVLVVALLAPSQKAKAAASEWICDSGCVNWDARYGCLQYMTCCSNSNGDWFCIEN